MSDATNSNGFFLTLGTAAKQLGLSKSTISRAIRLGKLSAIRCPETNSFKIDPAELTRFRDAVQVVRAEQPATPDGAAGTGAAALFELRCAVAEARLEAIERQLTDLVSEREHWRAESDRWRAQAEQALRLLPAAREPRRWRWWRRAG